MPSSNTTNLPPDLHRLIAKRLDTLIDIRSFRAVCQSWRSSIPPPPSLLSLDFPRDLKGEFLANFPFELMSQPLEIIASNTYIIDTPLRPDEKGSKPWLVRVEEHEQGKLRVLRSLTHHLLVDLPQSFPKSLILSNVRVIHVSAGYNFKTTRPGLSSYDKLLVYPTPQISSSGGDGGESATPNSRLCSESALVLLHSRNLYLFHLENNKMYSVNAAGGICIFDDIIRFRECTYTVDYVGKLYSFTSSWQTVTPVTGDRIGDYPAQEARKRLVEWRDNLYLVRREDRVGVIRVYKLNEQNSKWEKVEDLGGNLLIVATDFCFFADTKCFPGWEENTVIFHLDSFRTGCSSNHLVRSSWFNDIGVYRWGDTKCNLVSSNCGMSQMFWPPPRWLAQAQ